MDTRDVIQAILLEPDAPYFRPSQYQKSEGLEKTDWISFVAMSVNVAFIVARPKKGMHANDVIRATTFNTRRMYRIDKVVGGEQKQPEDQQHKCSPNQVAEQRQQDQD
ncbi:hypothetical protein Q1695_012873 [Nippostrongylus brasiliensis]|nr:hypothetical protein Q1695_012873 [Nippostrongylus brasiliensis]